MESWLISVDFAIEGIFWLVGYFAARGYVEYGKEGDEVVLYSCILLILIFGTKLWFVVGEEARNGAWLTGV